MLAKLLKYEFKSTSRVVLILYAVLLAVAALIGILMRSTGFWTSDLEFGLFGSDGPGRTMSVILIALFIIYWALIMAVLIMTIITIVVRFYRNLLGGEGYLMHTLPVKTQTLINAKLITAFIWMMITYLAIFLSALLLASISGLMGAIFREIGWDNFVAQLKMVFGSFNAPLWCVTLIVGSFAGILMFYFSMALGNLANEHKVLFAVLAYIGLNTVLSFVTGVSSISFALMIENISEMEVMMSTIMWRALVIDVALAVGFYIGTNLILKKRLNLA